MFRLPISRICQAGPAVPRLLSKLPLARIVASRTGCIQRASVQSSSRFSTFAATLAKDEDDEEGDEEDEESDSEEEEEEEAEPDMANMTPMEIVTELDKHIVGQKDAKKAVALALRNRWRRKKLDPTMREEVMPKNILMIGPTGVGKTEVARRLAKLVDAPFIKVEATKYTEIGFHGRDVDSIIRDLVEHALTLTKTKRRKKMKKQIDRNVERRILDAMVGKGDERSRKDFRNHYREGRLEDQTVSIEVPSKEPEVNLGAANPSNNLMININKQFMANRKAEKRKMKVSECRPMIEEMETERLVNTDDVLKEAIDSVQQDGIVFLDEIDKICSSSDRHSADASAEGVQRDLLPLIEGSSISTKHGNIDTDHILFIASGAFHSVKPSDLLAELQGRLPIRVNLQALKEKDFVRILTEPEHNLVKQQVQLMATEDVTVNFEDSGVKALAKVAFDVNSSVENIGARRLHTVIERVMEDISYTATEKAGTTIQIDQKLVQDKVADLLKGSDLKKFLL